MLAFPYLERLLCLGHLITQSSSTASASSSVGSASALLCTPKHSRASVHVCSLATSLHFCSTVQSVYFTTVQYGAAQCATLQYSTVQHSTVQHSTVSSPLLSPLNKCPAHHIVTRCFKLHHIMFCLVIESLACECASRYVSFPFSSLPSFPSTLSRVDGVGWVAQDRIGYDSSIHVSVT